ncbi:MAG: hypothetical protein ROO76_00190 [Terriglobia bacterium]|nr:hypothetical protein [Terriglobia bacterium]
MAKFAKVLIMLIRALALVAIVLGILIWLGTFPQVLPSHIGIGFLIALSMGILAIIAIAKRIFALGVLGIAAAILLPVIGLRQFPLAFRHLGPIQVSHIIIVFAALGIAESTYAAIRKTDTDRRTAGAPAS